MARGPYQGTFQPGIRPTVVTSPDALVFINGETEVIGCPKCKRKFDFNKYITTIQVDLSIDSVPGSASFNLSIPRHSVDTFYYDGNPLILPMMEVEIYAKGHFLVEGLPQYYPIFWGLTTEISDSYSGGEHTVSVNCADILKWWELCQMNINPAFTQALGQQGRSLFGNVYSGRNPYDVIWTLAQQSFGDVIVGSGSLLSFYKEPAQKATFATYMGHVMQYWEARFKRIRSNLLLYGTRGNAVRGDMISELWSKAPSSKRFAGGKNAKGSGFVSKLVRRANGGNDGTQMVFDPTDSRVTAFRTQHQSAGQVNFWQSEYQTKLELANSAKDCIGYEFFMDVDGSIVFKPPFYNLDVLGNKPVSWIQDIDIIDWDLSESEAEVVTQVQVQGSYGGNIDYGFGDEMTPATSVTDYHLLRRYGWRVKPFNSEFMGSTIHMFYLGMDLLDQYNARRFRGTVNIPLRPELRLGFPVYLAPKDQIWYVTGISHNITFGGRAQTTVTLTAKRSKFIAPKGIGTIHLSKYNNSDMVLGELDEAPSAQQLAKHGEFVGNVGDAAQIPPTNYPDKSGESNPFDPLVLRHPKTGRIVGYPNVVMAYTRPFAVPPKNFRKVAGQKDRGKNRGVAGQPRNKVDPKAAKDQLVEFGKTMQADMEDTVRDKYLHNRFSFGLTSAGVYTYLHDESSVIKEMLLISKQKVKFVDSETGEVQDPVAGSDKASALIRPVSDERGFEVIGHYKYGRGVSLRDGSLVLNEVGTKLKMNSRATVSQQPAVSGGLFESLQAQSQGLVSVYTGSANPAHAISTLDPTGSDLQTAGIINPEGKAEFTSSDNNFVDVAPLGSPQQKGTTDKSPANVEASQLSRALTLAELKVFTDGDSTEEECGCLMSRSDLAFINVGYQVKILRTTSADNTSQSSGQLKVNSEEQAIADRQANIADRVTIAEQEAEQAIKAELEDDPAVLFGSVDAQSVINEKIDLARKQALAQAANDYGISVEQAEADLIEGEQAEALRPVAEPVLTREEAISRVETYLTNLYQALDGPHQEYEKVLRGDYIERPVSSAENIRFSGESFNQQDLGGVEPPFSPSGRARGGDPAALAQQGRSARDNIEKAWGDFSDGLRANSERAALEERIRQEQKRVNDLYREIEELEKAAASGTVVTTQGSDIASLKKKLAQAEQDLAGFEQKLNTLNQEHPPT